MKCELQAASSSNRRPSRGWGSSTYEKMDSTDAEPEPGPAADTTPSAHNPPWRCSLRHVMRGGCTATRQPRAHVRGLGLAVVPIYTRKGYRGTYMFDGWWRKVSASVDGSFALR
jgi:hypothetical protein